MPDTHYLITHAYAAFNERNADAVFALMTEDVSWPKASEGNRVTGKAEIRAHWARQWSEFDPHVEPLEIINHPDNTTHVRVHQLVKSLSGDLLSDSEVWRIHTIANGLIARMDLAADDATSTPTAAFSRR